MFTSTRRWLWLSPLLISLLVVTSPVSAKKKPKYNYPKVSPDADIVLELRSNQEKTTFWVDGVEMPRGRRVKVLVNDQPHTIVAKPEGYIAKEEYVQPPYYEPFVLQFYYMIGEREPVEPVRPAPELYQPPRQQIASRTARDAPQEQYEVVDLGSGTYHALLIGNNEYQNLVDLETAQNDARRIGALLKERYGFESRVLLDATRADILEALRDYRQLLTEADSLIVYYAGHGWLDEEADEGYWLPVDADPSVEVDWLSNASLTSSIRAINARHVMVIADSCYSGKLTRGVSVDMAEASRPPPNYLDRVAAKRSRTVIASGGLEPVADGGGKDGHSVFASALIDSLQDKSGFFTGTDLFLSIRRPVLLNADQSPEYADIRSAGHDGGEFVFPQRLDTQ